MAKSSSSTTAVGVTVAILVVASVAAIAYVQMNVAPSALSTTTFALTTTSVGLPPAGQYVNVTIPSGASSPAGAPGYSPATVTVVMGVNNTVVWTNDDAAIHTVTALDNSFTSGNLNQGDVFMFTFATPGTYTYHCIYHSWMQGTVVVKSG